MDKECETCIKRKTLYCLTSIECMATDDMPYYQNRIMLLEENKELKKKYENAVADYEKTMFEKEQLNSLVNSCQEEIRQLKKQLTTYKILHRDCKVDNLKKISKIEEKENQQKEFINYLEDEIKRLKENDIYQPLQKMALATHEHILQKYKSIIGGKE